MLFVVIPIIFLGFNSRPRVGRAAVRLPYRDERSFQFAPACGAGDFARLEKNAGEVSIRARVWGGRPSLPVAASVASFQFAPACGAGVIGGELTSDQ